MQFHCDAKPPQKKYGVHDINSVATKNTAEAASIVLAKMRPGLLEYRRNVRRLREVIEPIMGFHWNRSLICAVWADKFNDLVSIIKSSELPLEDIDKPRKLVLGAFFDPSLIFPTIGKFGDVALLISTFSKSDHSPLGRRSRFSLVRPTF